MATTTATQIQQLYVGLLGRAADQGGLNWWADQVTTGGKTLEDVRASFVTSTEYTTTYGAAATRADLVTSIYQNLFERTPSADEVKYWAETDTRPADQLVAAFIEFAGAADQAVINNKTFVAQTYTDTVGSGFSAEGAKAVIADVDGTAASVTTALAAISAGTLPGQVPGLALVNAVAAAEEALVAYEKANTAAVDALVAKLAATEFNTKTKDIDAQSTYAEKLAAIKADAAEATADKADTANQLNADVLDSTAEVKAITDVLSVADKKLVADYDAAVAANAALKAPVEADIGAAQGGLGGDTGFTAALAEVNKLTLSSGAVTGLVNAKEVYDLYVKATTNDDDRALLDAALKGDAYASSASFKATAAADAAKFAAIAKEESTKVLVDAGTTSADYSAAVATLNDNKKLLIAAQAAEANQNSADTVAQGQKTQENKIVAAKDAITEFNKANVDSKILDQSKIGATVVDTVKDTFYFAEKPTGADFTFASKAFGAGDSIVLGSGYSFNNGALTSGDNNKLEFFLQKTDTGTQVVIESKIFGSDSVTADAHTGVATNPADAVTVINLVGVTAEHLSVANGVVSYV
ncbi:DUF4214 domain-containing protein [Pseudomonas helleri]|uniref:DUF4214 domain-containing protein n=1 Tax=Pseudomonas helleri TaxID=1608996 RepID=UPI003FD29529